MFHFRIVTVVTIAALCLPLHADPAPRTIGFMGMLNDPTGKHKSGDFSVALALYDVPTGGTALWSESQTVHVTNGLFSTALGKSASFPTSVDFSKAYFVGVSVAGDTEMQPRIPLQGVPYALFAQNVANDPSLLNKVSGGAMSTNGVNVGIGTSTPAATLDVSGSERLASDGELLFTDSGQIRSQDDNHRIMFRRPENKLELREYGDIILSAGSTGRGETDTLVAGAGGNVGIGTATPNYQLSLGGNAGNTKMALWDNGATAMGLGVGTGQFRLHLPDSTNRFSFLNAPDGSELLTIKGAGNVGIGASSPLETLDVNGTLGVRNGVIQKGGAGPISTTTDLGLYSVTPGNWLRLVANNAPIQFFTNFNAGAGTLPNADSTAMTILADGGVGIGTTNPAAKLDVRGPIAMDDGSIRAAGSVENLRIVRGSINFDGSVILGTGFTVTHPGVGQYQISFSPAFAHPPTVTCTALNSIGNRPRVVSMNNVWSASSVTLYTSDIQADFAAGKNGNFEDQPFNFIAVGPR